eukprot:jgi/Undpi1/11734/HiC_scaffold_37.g14029.m1
MAALRDLAVLAIFVLPASAQEWARFRGPDGQGRNDAVVLPAPLTKDHVLWRVPAGGTGHSSPVLWEDRLFLTRVLDRRTRELVCFDAENGKELWQTKEAYEPTRGHRLNSNASSTPAADAKGIYHTWTTGTRNLVEAWDHDGEKLWTTEIGTFKAQHGSGSSCIVHGDRVLAIHDVEGDGPSACVALDRQSGKILWRLERTATADRATYSCPLIWTHDGEPFAIFASTGDGLFAVDLEKGKVMWEVALGFRQRVVGAPTALGDLLLVTAGAGGAGRESAIVRVGREKGEVVHRPRRTIPYVPGSVAVDGIFMQFNDGGVVSAVDAKTGATLWKERVEEMFFGSAVTDGRSVFIVGRQGGLHSIAAKRKYQHLGTLDLGAGAQTTPAIAGGRLFVRTTEELICLGAKE